MGAVSFSIPRDLVEAAAAELPFEVFVETGTFEGDGIAAVMDLFPEIHSVELSPIHFEKARARFAETEKVRVVLGDSVEFLRDMASLLRDRSVLFYLDAHWCAAEGSAGEKSQCPLLDEIRAIGAIGERSLILIDDARLFLATPPEPHEVSNWPSFDAIDRALRGLSRAHELMVVNDVIVFHPASITPAMRLHARRYGVDWLRARQSLEENEGLRATLEGKEAEIRMLHATASERDAVLQEQGRLLTELRAANMLLEPLRAANAALQQQLSDRAAAPAANAAPHDVPLDQQATLMKLLDDKEAVIREMSIALRERTAALHAYRGAFVLFSFLLVPLNFIGSRVRRYVLRGAELMTPRLGMLNQHRPRELQIPSEVPAPAPSAACPRITIVTPSYGQAQFIERTIASVLDQRYPNLEYRVQDGGSRDGTVDILRRYQDRMSGWDSRPDSGQSQAINRAFEGTTGEIMAWLNSDDVLFPGTLACVADYFARHPDVDVIYSHRILIDEDDRQIGRWILPSHSDKVLSWADFVPQETLFWRRRIWEKAGGRVDESFRFAMDWDLLLRFREAGARFARVPHFLGGFRIHGRQKTSAAMSDVGYKEMDRLRERVLGRVPSQAEIRKAVLPYLLRHVAVDVPWKLRDGFSGARA